MLKTNGFYTLEFFSRAVVGWS